MALTVLFAEIASDIGLSLAFEGYNANRRYIIPSLDLVVVRVGAGPVRWNEPDFINRVVAAILSDAS